MEDQKKQNIKQAIKSKTEFKLVSVKISVKQYKYMKARGLNMSKLLRMSIDELMK